MKAIESPGSASPVALQARVYGRRIADEVADRLDACMFKWIRQRRYQEFINYPENSFHLNSIRDDEQLLCLIVGFAAGVAAVLPKDLETEVWIQAHIDRPGGICETINSFAMEAYVSRLKERHAARSKRDA